MPLPARAQNDPGYAEELIVEVVKKPWRLSDGLIILQRDTRFYVPLSQLAKVFDFFVEEDLASGYVSGWYLKEENAFIVDAGRGELTVKGERQELNAEDVVTEQDGEALDDVYLSLDVVNRIWPVELSVDMSNLLLEIQTKEKLPFEARIEREQKREYYKARKNYQPTTSKNLPFIPNPYGLLGLPSLDIETSYKWDDRAAELTGQTSVNGTQDIAGMSAQYAASFSLQNGRYREPQTMRMRLQRQAFGEDDIFLGFKNIELGDTRVNPPDLVANGLSGRGFTMSSESVQRDISFDKITVEGTALPGWEVELYRNTELLDYGLVDDAGEYRFENVELTVGNNSIRVVLYGPQGQIEERTETHTVSGNMAKPGETRYEIGYVDTDRPLIRFQPDVGAQPKAGTRKAFVAHGLTKWLTLFGSATDIPVTENETVSGEYLTGGAVASALGTIGQAEYYKQPGGGSALDLRFLTQMFGVRLNAGGALYRDFESPLAGYGTNAKRYEAEIHANANVKTPIGALGLQLDVDRDKRKNGQSSTTIATRESLSFSGIRLTNGTNTSLQNTQHVSTSGNLDASVRIRRWQLRSGLGYTLFPERQLNTGQAELRYKPDSKFSAAVSAQHDFLARLYKAGFQVGYDFEKTLGSFDVDWAQNGGLQLMVRASTSLGPIGPGGRYDISSEKLSQSSGVRGKVFLDNDQDGKFSEGDLPLEGAKLLLGGRGTLAESGADGLVTANASGVEGIMNVEIDKSSLDDPYYRPALEGYSTVPRPGSQPYFEFPVIETGSIEGTVLRDSDGSPVQGMRIEIIDEKGNVFDTIETAYDGFYSIDFVPPGTYTVRADPSYGVDVPPQVVVVTSEDLFASGIDLQLMEQAGEAPEAVEPQSGDSGGVAHTLPENHDAPPTDNGTSVPAPSSSQGGLKASVNRVRIGEYPDKVRLVLDLSGPLSYRTQTSADGSSVYVDLPGAAWDALTRWRADSAPVLRSFETEALPEGGTRMRLQASSGMSVGLNGVLKPDGAKGYRLFIDLVKSAGGGTK